MVLSHVQAQRRFPNILTAVGDFGGAGKSSGSSGGEMQGTYSRGSEGFVRLARRTKEHIGRDMVHWTVPGSTQPMLDKTHPHNGKSGGDSTGCEGCGILPGWKT